VDEATLLETLRRIEALHAGTTSDGEREAARGAAERIRARLAEVRARARLIATYGRAKARLDDQIAI